MRAAFPSLFALLLAPAAAPIRAADEVLGDFPLEVLCGISPAEAAPPGAPPPPGGARPLGDIPFDPSKGYGYLGGEARRESGAAAFGGDPARPLAWREGPRKYGFHVPNGEYLLRLCFLETEVAEAGLRVFDVLAEDGRFLAGVDIAAEAGDFNWLAREGLVQVRDGWLDIGFLARRDSLPPRVSRIRIEPAASVPDAPAPPVAGLAEPGPLRVVLSWERPSSDGIAGFGVFRAESREGPFESLTPLPVETPVFIDERPREDPGAFYRIRAYGVRGGQSPFTPVIAARAGPSPQGLRVFDLSVPDADLRRLHERSEPPAAVRATLQLSGATYPVAVSSFSGKGRWQAKKSYRLLLEAASRRALLGRREVILLAEAGDPTLLREKLSQEADRLAGLADPEVNFVHLKVNGRYQGIYVDREALGAEFRKRTNLDRFGALTEVPGRLRLAGSGGPYGRTGGQTGDQSGLTSLVEELNRLDEGELEGFFEDRFYLDRLIDRLAMSAIRGVDPARDGSEAPRLFLDDSRNGKFSLFDGDRRGGDFGIADFEPPGKDLPGAARAVRSLLGFALAAVPGGDGGVEGRWRVLETRLLSRPALRERYFARIEAILRDILTPERFDGVLAAARGPLAAALFPGGEPEGGPPQDLFLWPRDRGATFRAAPLRIASFFRAHRSALLEAAAAERGREPEPICLNELFLGPRAGTGTEGVPWIEIYNRSGNAVDLGSYTLTADLDRPRAFRFPQGSPIDPGARRLVVFAPAERPAGGAGAPISCPLSPSPDGGELGLFREGPSGRPFPADLIFYGRRTAGFSSCRMPDGSSGWAHVASPTPGEPNEGRPAAPPPWKYRSGIEVQKSGDLRLWLQVSGSIESASAHLREEGLATFESVPLVYNKESFRYELILGPERLGRRIDYYFSARSPDGLERAYPLPGPQRVLRVPVRSGLVINEVLPRPRRQGPYDEFVEIYNASDQEASVDGMYLSNSRRNSTKFRIAAKEPILPKGFLVIHADGRGEGTHANFHLGNAGGFVGLYTGSDEGNVMIDQVAFPGIPVGQSYGRERDGAKVFKVWRDPTPGARNIPKIPSGDRKQAVEPPESAPEETPETPEPPDDEK